MIIENTGNFSVMKTFDCGQCFRFEPVGEDWSEVSGTVGDYPVRIKDLGGAVEIDGDGERDFWEKYLSLDTDYAAIDGRILSALDGENVRQVMSRRSDAARASHTAQDRGKLLIFVYNFAEQQYPP